MLHDKYLPEYHFVERHTTIVKAHRAEIFKLSNSFDFSGSRLIRFLFFLRGMSRQTAKQDLLKSGFIELESTIDQEIILGLVGQFWKGDGNLVKVAPEDFIEFHRPGFVKATWNFHLADADAGTTLHTETRIQCLDEYALKKFSMYWTLIRPFSGLIRKEMLRSIRKQAERSSSMKASA